MPHKIMVTVVGRSDAALDSHGKALPRLHLEMFSGELHLHEAVRGHMFVGSAAFSLNDVSLLAGLWRSLVRSIV